MNDATECLKALNEILKTLIGFSGEAPPLYVRIIAIALLLIALLSFLHFQYLKHRNLYDSRRLRISRLSEYVNKDVILDAELNRILAQERDEQIFAHIYGYMLEKKNANC